jgi:glycerophosphoryl diester phosphodiesterase
MHDATVDRTTNGKGKIADMTLAEIKQLKLRAGHNVVTQHNVPTLEEVLNLVKGKILVNIDKGDNYFDEIYDLLVKTGTEKQVVIKTYDDLATIQSKNKNDIVRKSIFMPIINLDKKRDAEDVLAEYMTVNPAAYEICFSQVTPKVYTVLEKVKATGGKLWLNSMWPKLNGGHDDDLAVEQNKPDEAWGWLLKQGAKLIQTDRPADLIKYLKKKHRH